MSLLVRCEILGLLLKPLITNAKYPRHNRRNLPEPIQMDLS